MIEAWHSAATMRMNAAEVSDEGHEMMKDLEADESNSSSFITASFNTTLPTAYPGANTSASFVRTPSTRSGSHHTQDSVNVSSGTRSSAQKRNKMQKVFNPQMVSLSKLSIAIMNSLRLQDSAMANALLSLNGQA